MKKIDRYILLKFIKSFLIGTFAFLNIFILSELFRIMSYIMDGKLNFIQGMELLLVGLPEVAVNVVPLGILLGGLMTINKMATNLEIIALKTSGISFKRIILSPIIFSIFISLFMLWFNNDIVPKGNKRKRELKYKKIYKVKDSRIKTDVFLKGSGNYLYYIRLVNGGNQTINNIEILEMNDKLDDIKRIIIAKKGKYDRNLKRWVLYKVKINNVAVNETSSSEIFYPGFIKEDIKDFLRDKIREDEMTVRDLNESAKFIKKTGGDTKKIMVSLYKKTAYPFAGLIMSFIGLSLGSRYVRGASAVSIGLSVVIGYIYYVVMATTEAMGIGGFLSPILGAWIPNIIFLGLGIFTMSRAEY
ncbi:MAG: hypothetical protein B6I28_02250 [Fusobacteriia bacterium 4572_132]|nr:MAG: hypothetical protein B6I28_02250 [Fusobacteriia bacterium 4572_132]